ncbi:MAG: rod shape-determining protein MreD [Desulfobacterales bacterium]|jgi:rod shape-determining protein MreD|nr:rod shape-determining protein MreD [Desulfobacterales bacterium]
MNYFIYITCGLFMVICQTTVIPRLAFVGYLFDLVLPVVVYLAAFRPLHEALPFTVFLGVLMDNLSGGPFGLYLTSYVWLFIAARAAATVVRAENPIMIVLILIAAVATQNALFFAILGASGQGDFSGSFAVRVVTEQIGWVLLVGPFLAGGIRTAHRYSSRRAKKATIGPPPN